MRSSSSSHHEHHIEIIFIYETSRPKCSTVHTKAYTNCTLHWSSWLCLVAKKWRNRGKQMKRYIQECNVPPTWILLPSIRLLCSDLAGWLAGSWWFHIILLSSWASSHSSCGGSWCALCSHTTTTIVVQKKNLLEEEDVFAAADHDDDHHQHHYPQYDRTYLLWQSRLIECTCKTAKLNTIHSRGQ